MEHGPRPPGWLLHTTSLEKPVSVPPSRGAPPLHQGWACSPPRHPFSPSAAGCSHSKATLPGAGVGAQAPRAPAQQGSQAPTPWASAPTVPPLCSPLRSPPLAACLLFLPDEEEAPLLRPRLPLTESPWPPQGQRTVHPHSCPLEAHNGTASSSKEFPRLHAQQGRRNTGLQLHKHDSPGAGGALSGVRRSQMFTESQSISLHKTKLTGTTEGICFLGKEAMGQLTL